MTAQTYRAKRATDLFPIPPNPKNLQKFAATDREIETFVKDLETSKFTGVVQSASRQNLSRSAMLLYKGRAVACASCNKESPEPPPTVSSILQMFSEFLLPDTQITMYDLEEEFAVPFSAMFLGHLLKDTTFENSKAHFQDLQKRFSKDGSSACIAMGLENATCITFFFKGKLTGFFLVDLHEFETEEVILLGLLDRYPSAHMDTFVLHSERSSRDDFGFELSSSLL